MKLLSEVDKILEKYNLIVELPEGYNNIYDYERKNDHKDIAKFMSRFYPPHSDWYFVKKYDKFIPDGWYGFSIGTPTPKEWFDAIEEILDLMITNDPKFEIHQIKVKYGAIMFYCDSDIIDDLNDIMFLIMKKMYSKYLIY
jgi:hypothetical protein